MFTCICSPAMAMMERLKTTRPSGRSPNTPTSTRIRRRSSRTSISSVGSRSWSPNNRSWHQLRQRKRFLEHLEQWSLDHDSSPHFQGKISLLPQDAKTRDQFELGKSVQCILTDTSLTDARQKIVIRLFGPKAISNNTEKSSPPTERRDSMNPLDRDSPRFDMMENMRFHEEKVHTVQKTPPINTSVHYKLVIRSGAGWMSAREYFSKVYFSHQEARRNTHLKTCPSLDASLAKRSQALGLPPLEKDSVTIRPLFRPFLRLPLELQELVLSTAAGLKRTYNLCSDDYGLPKAKKSENQNRSPISLASLFGISKVMNQYLVPYVYHSTNFHFGVTGFTNFLWQSGPSNRPEIRRLTFHFGKMALLHCIRWLAPDPVFSLFEPPVATNPRSLQYFWRCQIQDLAKELHLLSLTIDVRNIPSTDLPMVVAIMKYAFGSVERVTFVETDNEGVNKTLVPSDERLKGVDGSMSWRQMCQTYYARHRRYSYFFKFELLRGELDDIEKIMDVDQEFFGGIVK